MRYPCTSQTVRKAFAEKDIPKIGPGGQNLCTPNDSKEESTQHQRALKLNATPKPSRRKSVTNNLACNGDNPYGTENGSVHIIPTTHTDQLLMSAHIIIPTGILRDRGVPLKLKGNFYRMAKQALLYGSECWLLERI